LSRSVCLQDEFRKEIRGIFSREMKKLAVLLVDDKEEFVLALSERLKLHGMEVDVAIKGEDALALLQEKRPDVVVLDVMMPGMGGLEILKRIKKAHPDVQVILLTGHGSTKDGIEGMRLGAFDYLMKPANTEELIAKMEACTDGRVKE
jgi:DNA-binding response OmpR family regulator